MVNSKIMAPLVAEFLGTYILVLTVGCNVLSQRSVWGGVSIASSLMVMIYALGSVSGANFNPAVSLALGIQKAMDWAKVGMYMAAQLLGGVLAGCTYLAVFGSSFNLAPTPGHSFVAAAFAEIFYTFMLCFVVLNVAVSKEHAGKNEFFGLAIGFVVVAGAYSGGSISMGCFNPAVAFGIDISSIAHGLGHCLSYTICEFIGAVIAVLLFWVVRPDERPYNRPAIGERVAADPPLTSKLVSEFIGTFMLVLTVGLNVLGGSTAAVFSIAASLMCMIFALGSVSGAHFNPAVTVAILASGRDAKLPAPIAGAYIGAQVLGGITAGFTYSAMKGWATFALKPEASGWVQAMFGEFVFTAVLAFVVLSVAVVQKKPLTEFFGLAIGMCVVVGGLAIGTLSGGSLNPAVSFGISMSNLPNGGRFWPCLVYSLVEVLGGAAAAGVFYLTHPEEFPKKGSFGY